MIDLKKLKSITTKVTYLELQARPPQLLQLHAKFGERLDVKRAHQISINDYLKLYRGVGELYHWTDRLLLRDAELLEIIQNPKVEIWVLRLDEQIGGYIELDRRVAHQVAIAYFGIFPDFQNLGLGSYLLKFGLEQAWSQGQIPICLNTCDLDAPGAIEFYQKFGFKITKTLMKENRII